MTAAQELNRPDVWSALAKEAWRQGNHEIVELCYQHMHAFDHLAFLYVVTGDTEKLQKMMRIAELRQDVMNQFQTALFLGDVAARVAILQQTGQTSLAYLTAATNGLEEQAAQLKSQLEEEGLPVPTVAASAALLTPPIIVNQCANWPLKELPCSQFDKLMREADTVQDTEAVFDSLEDSPRDAEVEADVPSPENVDEMELSDSVDSAWSDDLDFGSESEEPEEPAESLRCGASVISQWSQSSLAHDAAAAGDVASAARLLQKQLGLARVTALRSGLQNAFLSVQAVAAGFPGCPPLATPVLRSVTPPLPFTSANLASATGSQVRRGGGAGEDAAAERAVVCGEQSRGGGGAAQLRGLRARVSSRGAVGRREESRRRGDAAGDRVPDGAMQSSEFASAADAALGDGGGVQEWQLHRRGWLCEAHFESQRHCIAEEREFGGEGEEGACEEHEGGSQHGGGAVVRGSDRERGAGESGKGRENGELSVL